MLTEKYIQGDMDSNRRAFKMNINNGRASDGDYEGVKLCKEIKDESN